MSPFSLLSAPPPPRQVTYTSQQSADDRIVSLIAPENRPPADPLVLKATVRAGGGEERAGVAEDKGRPCSGISLPFLSPAFKCFFPD